MGLSLGLTKFFYSDEGGTDTPFFQEEKNIVRDYYFRILENFFEKNSEKGGNINNLKIIFRFIDKNLEANNKINMLLFEFIERIIGDNPDDYFCDDKDNEQINILFNFVKKFTNSGSNITKYENNTIKNIRKKFLNKMIETIMKIIFTKRRINKNPKIIENFKNILINIDLTGDLIKIMTKQIKRLNYIVRQFAENEAEPFKR